MSDSGADALGEQILDSMSEAVLLVRVADGTIVYVNAAFERIFGFTPLAIVGQHISTINAPTVQAGVLAGNTHTQVAPVSRRMARFSVRAGSPASFTSAVSEGESG